MSSSRALNSIRAVKPGGLRHCTGCSYLSNANADDIILGTTLTQQAELTASDAAANDEFGRAVAISGSTAVVGADGKNSSTCAAYAFAGL